MATLTTLSLVFATITATGGFVLALAARAAFAGSPFGRLMDLLALILGFFAAYHGLLVAVDRPAIALLESVAFTGLLVFVGLMFRLHHRLSRRPEVRE